MSDQSAVASNQQWMSVAQVLALAEQNRQANRLAEAVDLCQQVLRAQPKHAEAMHLQGVILHQGGDAKKGIELLKQAIKLNDAIALFHCNLGEMCRLSGRVDEAIAAGRKAVSLQPIYPQGWNNLGIAYYDREEYGQAEECYRRAVRQDPNFAEAHSNLGNALRAQHRLDEALPCYNRAIQLRPNYVDAIANMASVLHLNGQIDEAIATYRRVIALDPVHANAHSGLGLLVLGKGDFDTGWFGYEWRLRSSESHYKPLPGPLWEGDPLKGRRILIHTEQGFGDTLQFCRYLAMVRDRGGRIVMTVPPALGPLLAHSMPWLEIVTDVSRGLPPFDCHCPLLSLPQRFQTRVETIPARVPFLQASPEAHARWLSRIGGESGFKVGLVWCGNPKQLNDINRSMPAAAMLPLLDIEGARFYSLQVGYQAGDLPKLSGGKVEDLAPHLTDYMETAGAIANLDLVISVCTSVAHLAGAMASPLWVALSWNPDWRWLEKREDCPWYPSARLFRQKQRRVWESVIADIAGELRAVIGGDRLRLMPYSDTPLQLGGAV